MGRIEMNKRNRRDLIGKKFNRLTVLRDVGISPRGSILWECVCDCGNIKNVSAAHLVHGGVKSCGCLEQERREKLKNQGTHNHCRRTGHSPTWSTWKATLDRCMESHKSRKYYYDKGITVCDRWKTFENFLADMGERPDNTTLDRKDGDKGYNKENCRWATKIQQANNKECVLPYTYDGETKGLTEWSRDSRCKVSAGTLWVRIFRYKFGFVESLITPKGKLRK